MRLWLMVPVLIACSATAGCVPSKINLPANGNGYAELGTSATPPSVEPQAYRIGDGDTLRINVFQENDLSLDEARVDVNGNVTLPLIGDVPAIGLTSSDLAGELTTRLRRYLVNPQVTVAITKSVSQRIFVEGEVNKGGTFALDGDMTLLGALALAESTTEIADTKQVLIFRTIAGKRYGAKFDVNAIRAGQVDDPHILPQDLIVVGTSSSKKWVRNLIQLSPVFGSIFIALNQN